MRTMGTMSSGQTWRRRMRTSLFPLCWLLFLMLDWFFRWSASLGGNRVFNLDDLLFGSLARGLLHCFLGCFGWRVVELRGREEGATRDDGKRRWMSSAGSDRDSRAECDTPSKERQNHFWRVCSTRGRKASFQCHALTSVTRPVTRASSLCFPSLNSSRSVLKRIRSSSPSRRCSAPSMLADFRPSLHGPTSCPSTTSYSHRPTPSTPHSAHHRPRRTHNSPSHPQRVHMRTLPSTQTSP